ncbi:hypothetical protein [Terrabacter sp. NPDC000476]|uniref:hypothetical protein n=1 Tax=Terrabacter sp. NPDC000476 TaxID=3154258 RepID=UPI003322BB86
MNEHADRDHSVRPDARRGEGGDPLHASNVAADVALGLNVVDDGTRGVPTGNVPTQPGTSRPVAARATPAQVEAAMRALGCRCVVDWQSQTTFCDEHQIGRGGVNPCLRAEAVADAVVAAEGAASLATGERPGDDAEPTVPTKDFLTTIEEPA